MSDQSQETSNPTSGENEAHEPSNVPRNNMGEGADMNPSSHATAGNVDDDSSGDPSSNPLATRLKAIEDKMKELEGPENDTESDSDDPDEHPYMLRSRFKLIRNMEHLIEESTRTLSSLSKNKKRRSKLRREQRDRGPDLELEKRLKAMDARSEEAIVRQEPANVVVVNWATFIEEEDLIENFLMSPIQVINSEPDPHILLSHANRASTVDKRLGPLDLSSVRSSTKRDPLPERIHLRSWFLCDILRDVTENTVYSGSRDAVLLRPYRSLVYQEKELKDHLEILELTLQSVRATGHDNASELGLASTEIAPNDSLGESNQGEKKTVDPSSEISFAKQAQGLHNVDHDDEKETTNGDSTPPSSHLHAMVFHLRSLMRFFDGLVKPTIDHLAGDECADVYYHDLWHLFKPGTEVIDQLGKQAYRVFRVQAAKHKIEVAPWLRWSNSTDVHSRTDDELEEQSPLRLSCVYIDFDGKNFGPVTKTFTITPFGGLQAVTKLPVYPLRLAANRQLRSRLIERGEVLLGMSKFKSMYYTGRTMDTREEVDSQVVVDFAEALTANKQWVPHFKGPEAVKRESAPECTAPCCARLNVLYDEFVDAALTEDFIKTLVSPDTTEKAPSLLLTPRMATDFRDGPQKEPSDDELVVMTHRVYGFVLRTRRWAKLDMTFLRGENIDANNATRSAFDQLALPDGHRDMVESLVTQHFRERKLAVNGQQEDELFDLVRGKGKGLIILLHGAPGVGKTTTAEGVAERFQKPLFSVTTGDLGTTAHEVDQELGKHFALASRWGCILLIDEAEVFLAAREKKDIQRNGLVAVFLRVLEYYTGVLFLTTNRVGEFDEAFASRINVSLYYPDLDEEKTAAIFDVNLNLIRTRYDHQGHRIYYDASAIKNFAKDHFQLYEPYRWNGRQIRNLCQTALSLAEWNAEKRMEQDGLDALPEVRLEIAQFTRVQKAYLDFAVYMGETRGTKGDSRAYDFGNRAKREDTPYYNPPGRLADRAEKMHKNRQQPMAAPPSRYSGFREPYESPSSSSWGGQSQHYQDTQFARPMGNPQQDYGYTSEPQRQRESRFPEPNMHSQYAYASTQSEQHEHVPGIQFDQSPSGHPIQSVPYQPRQTQPSRNDFQRPSQMYTGSGADDMDDTFSPPAQRGGPVRGGGRGIAR